MNRMLNLQIFRYKIAASPRRPPPGSVFPVLLSPKERNKKGNRARFLSLFHWIWNCRSLPAGRVELAFSEFGLLFYPFAR